MQPVLKVVESEGNILASLGFLWWQHMTARCLYERGIAAEVIDPKKNILVLRIQLRPSDPTILFVPYRSLNLLQHTHHGLFSPWPAQ